MPRQAKIIELVIEGYTYYFREPQMSLVQKIMDIRNGAEMPDGVVANDTDLVMDIVGLLVNRSEQPDAQGNYDYTPYSDDEREAIPASDIMPIADKILDILQTPLEDALGKQNRQTRRAAEKS